MLGLVTSGRLYLKTHGQNRGEFDARGLAPFEYMRQGQLTPTSYVEAPPEIYEDREEAARWARLAWEAVLRTPAPKKKKASARQPATKKPATRRPAAAKPAAKKPAARKRAPPRR